MHTIEIDAKVCKPWQLPLEYVWENNHLGITVIKKDGIITNVLYVYLMDNGEIIWNHSRRYYSPEERNQIKRHAKKILYIAKRNDLFLDLIHSEGIVL